MTTVAHAVAAALAPHIDRVFGLMGNGNAHLIDAFAELCVPYIAVRHEAATVAAADTHWRVLRRLAVATATYGAGFTNTITALAEAAQARIPLVMVVGGAPTTGARPWDVDQTVIGAAVGAPTLVVDRHAPAATAARAVRIAIVERRPVVLEIPYDLIRTEAAAEALIPSALPERATVDATALAEAARVLAGAERPVILAGRGAHEAQAGPALSELAERLGAVTTSTALGRGVFDDARYDLGVAGGFGQSQAMELIRHADVVLVAGASLSQFTMRFGELFADDTIVVQLDDQPAATHARVDRFVRGDVADSTAGLLAALGHSAHDPQWRPRALPPSLRERDPGEGRLADGLDPRSVAFRLAELLPEDRVVVSDGGHFIGWANMYWPVASPGRMVMVGTAYQTIGLGFPSAVGAATALPEVTTVLSTGDGGALMALSDLESLVRVARSCIVVVWNDAAYGAEVHLYGLMGLDEGPMRIPQVDFAALGAAVGATGVVVRELDDLDRLTDWVQAGSVGTIVLDCRVSSRVVAEYQREIQRVNGIDEDADREQRPPSA